MNMPSDDPKHDLQPRQREFIDWFISLAAGAEPPPEDNGSASPEDLLPDLATTYAKAFNGKG
jgi:hypothetical protein